MSFDLVKVEIPPSADKLVMSVLVMDMSTSMNRFGDVPREAVDHYVKSLCHDHNAFYVVAVIGFNNRFQVLIPPTEVNLIRPLEPYSNSPGTYLYGSVDEVLRQLKDIWNNQMSKEYRKRTRVVCGVFSDGEDSCSRNPPYPARVRSIANWAKYEGWELSAYGIGIDGRELAKLLGFDEKLSVTVKATRAGVKEAARTHTSRT